MEKEDETHEEGLVHDDVEIEDFEYEPDTDTFKYPCPCGDEFSVSCDDLLDGCKFAKCPSCSLMVRVIYCPDDLKNLIETKLARKPVVSSTTPPIKALK